MVSTFSPNLNLEEPGRGDQVGTWDTPVNNNMTIIDSVCGGTATIALTNANVTLSAAQYQCDYLVFTGTITANIIITFPYVGSFHTIENRTAGAFTVTLATSNVIGNEYISCPPYEPFDILTRASTAGVRFRNFGRVGEFMDYAGSSVPIWITNCMVPPYLNCDGTAFSSATYPALATILSTTVTPDSRGRLRATLNQGQSRITTAGSSIDGNTNLSAGGGQSVTLGASNLPVNAYTATTTFGGVTPSAVGLGVVGGGAVSVFQTNEFTRPLTISVTNASGGAATAIMPPTYVAGLTLIRAA